jgi:salicylate 5-hydroxylase small subunit
MISHDLRFEIMDLYAEYAACLDEGRFDDWPEFFTEACRYRVMPRENHDQGLPLATINLQSRGALKDRVYGVQSTLFHAPYYQRHIIGPVRVKKHADDEILVEANYLVIRTHRDMPSDLFNTGRYLDRVVATADGLRFAEKLCIFDSELISNSIIYPL